MKCDGRLLWAGKGISLLRILEKHGIYTKASKEMRALSPWASTTMRRRWRHGAGEDLWKLLASN